MDGLAYLHYSLVWDTQNNDRIENLQRLLAIALILSILSPTAPTLGSPVWQFGDYGPAIATLQDQLKNAGCFPATTRSTGYYGSITVSAVEALQARHGLEIDGITGPETKDLLDRDPTCESSSAQLQLGSRGDRVRKLQQQLNNWGVPPEPKSALQVDGVFGEQTQQSVLRFQQLKQLKADGVVDAKTSERLWEPSATTETIEPTLSNEEQEQLIAEFQALAIWLCESPEVESDRNHTPLREGMISAYSGGGDRVNWKEWSEQWCATPFDPQDPQNWGNIYQGYLGLP